jgi:hypothetical protein
LIFGIEPHEETYILFKFWVEEEFPKYDPNEFDDYMNVVEEDTPVETKKETVIYGWAPFRLFNREHLMSGCWKLPLYKTPLPVKVRFADLKR